MLAFTPGGEAELASVPGLSVGDSCSATQGPYSAEQLLLDITQGARVARSAYSPARPPAMALRTLGTQGAITGWQAALGRAADAPQLLRPGLLATHIPGGAAYAGIAGLDGADAIAAADRGGRVATVSRGTAPALLARVSALRRTHRLLVADLPAGRAGYEDLRTLSATRAPGELLLVVQRARAPRGHELLWAAAAGLSGGGTAMTLTSQTTNERGLIAAVDLAPTILRHLNLTPIPSDVRGDPIHTDGPLRSASLRTLMARLHVVGPRRLHALGWLMTAWALLLLVSVPWPSARAWAMRTGALGVLWAPVAVLIPATLNPSAPIEYLTIVLACLTLGALTDRLLPWPRAPLAPAVVAVAALSVDALARHPAAGALAARPQPDPRRALLWHRQRAKSRRSRVLVLAAVAAALYPPARQRRAAPGNGGRRHRCWPSSRARRGSAPVSAA